MGVDVDVGVGVGMGMGVGGGMGMGVGVGMGVGMGVGVGVGMGLPTSLPRPARAGLLLQRPTTGLTPPDLHGLLDLGHIPSLGFVVGGVSPQAVRKGNRMGLVEKRRPRFRGGRGMDVGHTSSRGHGINLYL